MKLQRAPLSNYRREEALVGMVGGWGETSERYRKNQQTYFSEINSETGRIFPIYFVPFLVLTSYREYGSSFTEKTKDHVNPACLNAAQSPGFRIRVGSQTPRQAPFHLTIRMGSKSKSSKLNHTQSSAANPIHGTRPPRLPERKSSSEESLRVEPGSASAPLVWDALRRLPAATFGAGITRGLVLFERCCFWLAKVHSLS
jgi:hypothetical protein